MPLLSIQHLTVAFQTFGLILAVPSLLGLGVAGLVRGTAAVSGRPSMSGVTRHSDIVIILLGGITWLLGSLAFVLASVGRFASRLLAVAGALGMAFAAALVVTAHGLGQHAGWALPGAAAITSLGFLGAVAVAVFTRRKARLLALLAATLCCLAFHTLWVGYAA